MSRYSNSAAQGLRPKTLSTSREGFTLAESVIATFVLGLLALGVTSGLIQTRRITEGSIHTNTATTIAQGYIEQLKSIEFAALDGPVLHTLINQGTPDPLTVSPTPSDPEAGDPAHDKPNTKLIDINNTPDEPGDDLAMIIVVYVDKLSSSSSGLGNTRRITLRYTFQLPQQNIRATNTLYAIRSEVPTF